MLLRSLLAVVGDALAEPQGRAALEPAAGPLLAALCAAAADAPAAAAREAALLVLLAAASLEHRRIFPYRADVLKSAHTPRTACVLSGGPCATGFS